MAENDPSNTNRLYAISWLLTDEVGGLNRDDVQEVIWKIIKEDNDFEFRYSVVGYLIPNNRSLKESLRNQFVKEVFQYMAANDADALNRQFAREKLKEADF